MKMGDEDTGTSAGLMPARSTAAAGVM